MTRNVRVGLIFLFAFMGFLFYFLRMREASRPERVRATMTASARQSCMQTGSANAARTKTTPVQIQKFCNCVTDKSIATMPDSEVLAAADRGSNANASDLAMIKGAAQICNMEVFGTMR